MENESKISYVSVFNENEVELSVTDGEGIYKVKVQVDRESLLQLITDFIDETYEITVTGYEPDCVHKTRIYVAKGKYEPRIHKTTDGKHHKRTSVDRIPR